MEHIIKTAGELETALALVMSGDRFVIDGRVSMTSPIKLRDRENIAFVGQNGAALDFMQRVTGFAETTVNGVRVFEAKLPDYLVSQHPYAAFADDGRMLRRPRLPKEGFYTVKGCPDFDLISAGQWTEQRRMIYGEGEVPVMAYPEVVEIRAFHWWTDEQLRIADVDYDNRIFTFVTPPNFAMRRENSKTDGARWYLDNVFEALNSPGEYFITPDCRTVYYVPEAGERVEGFALRLSTCEEIMTLENCASITFEGIEFKGSDRDKLNAKRTFSQAAVDVVCAVNIEHCTGVRFTDCRFTDIGLSCIGIDHGSNHVTIDRCALVGIGGNPVHIKGRNLKQEEWITTYPGGHFRNSVPEDIQHHINVTNCTIADYGRVYFNACGILLRYAYDCELSDNEIHDGYYTGISVGWVWGYAAHATNYIRIQRNHIYNIGKTLLSDMGGIYTLGHQEGTVIRGNRIHDIQMDSYGGWGVYLDEGSSDILVEENVCYDLSAQPFHQHYGANNLLRRNIFAFGEGGAFIVSRKEEHLSVILERNILVSKGTAIYAKPAEEMNITDCMNLVWNYDGESLSGSMNYDVYTRTYTFPEANRRTPAEMKAGGLFAGAIVADPLFVDADARDFRLRAGSQAEALGFACEE
ncbi:MAG: right-handed parallel beta-helix repeat-containing protein [Clostridia bacterium]|nr:right-handed parallel beta-helix repeat-containing protein [Clostridia bacterium]